MGSAETSEVFKLNIVTPEEGLIHEGEAISVTFETQGGQSQILPGHIPLFTLGENGSLVIEKEGGRPKIFLDARVLVAEVIGDVVTIIMETAESIKEETHQAIREAV
jgi:F0F1-type ATP synthase epsilon subunit